jgi:hypothetical protein
MNFWSGNALTGLLCVCVLSNIVAITPANGNQWTKHENDDWWVSPELSGSGLGARDPLSSKLPKQVVVRRVTDDHIITEGLVLSLLGPGGDTVGQYVNRTGNRFTLLGLTDGTALQSGTYELKIAHEDGKALYRVIPIDIDEWSKNKDVMDIYLIDRNIDTDCESMGREVSFLEAGRYDRGLTYFAEAYRQLQKNDTEDETLKVIVQLSHARSLGNTTTALGYHYGKEAKDGYQTLIKRYDSMTKTFEKLGIRKEQLISEKQSIPIRKYKGSSVWKALENVTSLSG